MSLFGALKPFIPQPHVLKDEDNRYNIGFTFIDDRGLSDCHNLELRYTRNSERMAVDLGSAEPDGSFKYVEPNGTVHTLEASKAKTFMDVTEKSAELMVTMLDKMKKAGVSRDSDLIDTPVVSEAA
tara:strand:+ start:246 stop:623 length:378 start_codon:yes stop_codon:yes gene_type:complete